MAAVDTFAHMQGSLISGAEGGKVITPSNSADLEYVSRGILVATAGALKVTFANGDVEVIPYLAAGVIHSIRACRIWSTDTTATGIMIFK